MVLAITDEHKELGGVARQFAADQNLRGNSRAALGGALDLPAVWKQIADLGWLGLHLPEEHGGSGYGLPELAVVLDELGYGISPGPYLPTVAASTVLAAAGADDLLPGLADGSTIAGFGLSAGLENSGGSISGRAEAVLGARWAHVLLLAVGDDVLVVPADHPAVQSDPVAGLDPSLGLANITITGLTDARLLAGAKSTAVAVLRTLAAAEAAGGARAALDIALDYAKIREQFGRTIGTFQAVKHHLANMLVVVELATATAWDAARIVTEGDEGRLAAAAAAIQALPAYRACAEKNIQLLGGIGFTWEHDAHLYLRRAATLSVVVGSAGKAEDELAELVSKGVERHFGVDLPEGAEVYREQAREFLARYRETPKAERRDLLVDSGYLVPHWPTPYGRGAGPVEQLVIEEELGEVESPNLGIGGWVLLTLTQTANPEQIERWVDASLRGDLRWCQLFSEPGAGSDAAAIQTRGVREEGGWRLNGQKVWTSGAQHCNRGLATVRTDPSAPKHKGVTAMVIDLESPGVTVRPLREITGDALFNEVFFDNVFVPDADVVGEVNDGWRVARATLGNERVTIGGGSRQGVGARELLALAQRRGSADLASTRAIATLIAEEQAMRLLNLRTVTRAVAGSGPGPEGNVTKLLSAEHAQRVTELALTLAGTAAATGEEHNAWYEYLFDRCLSIAGGTSEITRNVIAERILGLPRDPLIK